MKNIDFKTIYTIFVFLALAAFDYIILGLFPPLFSSIALDLNVHISMLGLVLAVNIFVSSVSAVFWGYLGGKYNRKMLIIIGTVFWAVSVFFTSKCANYNQLIISQVFTGIGLGCISSIGYSVLTDYIPHRYRGTILSLWGISQGFGGIAGAIMASLVSTSTNWRKPFEIVSIIGFLLIILYVFVKEPAKGSKEPELQHVINNGDYNYTIKLKSMESIIKKPSNILLFLQAFFYNIATGTLIWLPTLYNSKVIQQGYSPKTAIIASGYLYALFQIGGLTATFFGYLGDKVHKKSYRGRSRLAAFFMFASIPFYFIMYFIPMNNLKLSEGSNAVLLLFELLKQVFMNPWVGSIFLLSFIACQALSANTPNWLALITDVNLPEDRGAAFSIANLANGIGRTIGNAAFGVFLGFISLYVKEPMNFILTMCVFTLFFIPAGGIYLRMSSHNKKDINRVKSTLRMRAKHINRNL
ncbi:MAG: MFS transporter [Solirubrobacterales bacterium]